MSVTKADADAFIVEFEKDLAVYQGAIEALSKRRLEVEGTAHEEYFTKGSGVIALHHLLIMNIARVEGILEDLRANRETLPEARPPLQLVKDEAKHVQQ